MSQTSPFSTHVAWSLQVPPPRRFFPFLPTRSLFATSLAPQAAIEAVMLVPANESLSPNDALAQAVQKRPDGTALLAMHGAMGNLVRANGDLCKVAVFRFCFLVLCRRWAHNTPVSAFFCFSWVKENNPMRIH